MSAEIEGCAAARSFREQHRLGVQPLGDLIAIIEQTTGVDVAVLDAGPDEHGLTMRDPERDTIFVGVARTPHPMRQRSTLAHELGHIHFGDWVNADAGGWSERSPAEVRADAFARNLLLPLDGMREFLTGSPKMTEATLSAIVQRFIVSPAMAAIALHGAGCIDAATKGEWMALSTPHLAVRFGWIDQYQAMQSDSNKRRAPQKLLARATKGYAEGVLSAQAIASLRGTSLYAVEAELRDAGVTPAERPVAWADPADLPDVPIDLAALDADLGAPDPSEDPTGGTAP
ncbi:ImmA/IrrE family metallo-endopeptidase [Micromonospora fluostatini]|uniref:ImmA/IrrE family metallo-endopeptidase n=1 Tax=Micromonospora fluostatini TaxID=1629071 RepID=A0ABY2DEI6_9ACTN|nr:ImmA/IrrE family metallo-endopeptidase [Micromonospora fluostatini]